MGDRLGIHGAVDILLFLSSGLRSIFGFSEEMHPRVSSCMGPFGQSEKLSKTTKLILLDSLLQEVCIKSGLAGRSPVSSLRLSVCSVQSQSFFIQD